MLHAINSMWRKSYLTAQLIISEHRLQKQSKLTKFKKTNTNTIDKLFFEMYTNVVMFKLLISNHYFDKNC